ncbi:MAG: SIS domain-containing protein [Planctomycetes bacterium]|uniref:D-sedoheptulose-7-phosphate isomerase n=1 Tax=Candidatus Wunengus sp. YC65 TaxID=3367701 RepID=UPI001D5B8E7E|nr:SIS domain-containing protein [Planctomycetota bacterium]
MNNIDQVYQKAKNVGEFAQGYFTYLKQVLDSISTEAIDQLVAEFEAARATDNTLFVAGNGGSATTATSMANDIGFDIIKKTGTDKPFRILALTDNTSVITAISNDVGYDNIFVNQLKIHYRPGDKLLAISASGNSPNVVAAAEWVKQRGGRVIGFLGFTGGRLKDISDIVLHVKSEAGEYGPVEDAHLVLNHILAHWFQLKLR